MTPENARWLALLKSVPKMAAENNMTVTEVLKNIGLTRHQCEAEILRLEESSAV